MTQCPIWNTTATETIEPSEGTLHIHSPRAGGVYSITGSAISCVQQLLVKDKLLLTSWLCEQRSSGVTDPLITTHIIEKSKDRSRLLTSQRVERVLRYLGGLRLGETLTLFDGEFSENDPGAGYLAALTECEDKDELLSLLSMIKDLGWAEDATRTLGEYEFTPTARGWLKIEELGRVSVSGHQAFVAMWFNDETSSAYTDGIAPAISDCGYEAVRIDKKEHSNKIDDEIIAEIRRSRFLVADFTCEKERVRGGVYFEAGFAMGLNIPVIWACHKDSLNDLHFDTRQYSHVVWESPDELRHALKARIGAVVGDGPLLKR